MRSIKAMLILVAVLFSLQMSAQKIISVDELAAIYKNKEVLIISTRKASDYAKVHITGAINIYHKEFYKTGDIDGLIKDDASLAKMLGDNGVTMDKTIVLYDDKSGKYSSRVFWILDYLGYPDVKILDGQLEAWKAGKKPVTGTPSKGKKGVVEVKPDASKIATMKEVQDAVTGGAVKIIDARKTEEFNGSEGTYEPYGHIPGAIQLFYEDVVGHNGKFVTKEKMTTLLTSKGINKDDHIIIYCNTGILASVVYVGVKYVAGFENVKVYEGSYAEWVSVSTNKTEK